MLFAASLNFDDHGQTRRVSFDSFDAGSKFHIVFVDVIITQNLVFDQLAARIFNLRVQCFDLDFEGQGRGNAWKIRGNRIGIEVPRFVDGDRNRDGLAKIRIRLGG